MRNIFSRRQFLGAVGAGFGLATMGSLQTLALTSETYSAGKLGFILPESKFYPQLASELLKGISDTVSKNHKISRLENTSLESLKNFAKASDTIITYASPSSAALLRKSLSEDATQVIAADLGMDIQRFGEELPRLNYISLNYWQLSQALALWVKENLGERLLIVTDSYTSGYDAFSLFETSFPNASIMLYQNGQLAGLFEHETFDAIAFALSTETARSFGAEYEALGLSLPLVRLPFIDAAVHTSRPIYSASFAFDNSPFYALGQRTAMVLEGRTYDESPILIKAKQQAIAQYLGSQLPYHGISSRVKTGWTNPYPI